MNDLFRSRSSSIRQTADTRASQKAMYRFLDNENVSESDLIASCCERTGDLCKDRHLLVLNDTSEINLHSHVGRMKPESGIGLTGNNRDIGFFVHLGLVVDSETEQTLGFSSMQLWHRPADKENKEERNYTSLPVEEKESYKWIKCGFDSRSVLSEASSITLVGDRESDMYELFADAIDEGIDLVVRNRISRKTTEGKKLYDLLSDAESAGSYTINVQGDIRKQTINRKATLEVKYREVKICKPNKKRDARVSEVKVWIIEAKEQGMKGICWRLITTHSISGLEDCAQIIEWYKKRWYIEEVFRLLKSKGYRIEDSQIESGWALRKLTIMLLHNILRVMQMLIAYGSSEEQDADMTFSEGEIECLTKLNIKEEGKTDKLKNKHKTGTLKWATWIIARLGGWSGYVSQRPPGPITLKNGLDKFNIMYTGWQMAKDVGTQ